MPKTKPFRPDWSETPPAAGTYRAIFKYGAPERFKHPSDQWYAMLKAEFGMRDDDFRAKQAEGRQPVALKRSSKLTDRPD